jgi:lipopolysaccharide/colanic/teichoic acid biosynthesis glycosyltransferase
MYRMLGQRGWLSRLLGRHQMANVLSATELEQTFQSERSRVDRNGHVFSLAVFLPADDETRDVSVLVKMLKERIRTSDVIGQLDKTRIAVILPETDSTGCWRFADDMLVLLAEASLAFNCEVYSYPIDWENEGDADSNVPIERQDKPTGTSGVGGEIHSLLQYNKLGVTENFASREGLEYVRDSAGERPVGDLAPLFVERLPIWKRLMDILVSATLLILAAPLFALVAVGIRLTSPGPIIFRQLRAGVRGEPFTFLKFRSMYIDAEARKATLQGQNEADGPIFKMRNDPRMTPIGRFLRRSSIDELPQLWNVLRGDMTLVGPRPPTMDEVPRYQPWQRGRLNHRGGLVCIREVNGRSEVAFEEWMRMDLRYLARKSFLLDVKLLFQTARAVISGRGAY